AAGWPDQVPAAAKKNRALALKGLDQEKRAKFLRSQYPLKHLALVENAPDSHGRQRLLTGSYVRAVWAGPGVLPANSFVWARLKPPPGPGLPPEAWPWEEGEASAEKAT
ncbi:MAG: hypothetical protein LBE01_05190, partial [Deltaproteobacteria bacterium]|nr:hypothetical protein [Deltaproteobacteria bacterium]